MTPETRAALALVEAGVAPDQVDRVLRMIDLGHTETAESVAEKVDALSADLPGLFVKGGRRPSAAPGPGAAGTVTAIEKGRARHAGKSMEDLGAEALREVGITSRDAMDRARARFEKTHGRPPNGDAA